MNVFKKFGKLAAVLTLALALIVTLVPILYAHAAAGQEPAHSKTLQDNHDGTYKLSLTVTGDADTDSNTASNANVIIVFDTSNSMVNYYVPMENGARGSNNEDGSNSYVLYYRDGNQYQEASDGYTGTVYRRNGNNNYSVYTGTRYSKTIRRADAAEKVLYDFAHALYGYQNEDDPSTPDIDESKNIQTALITFNQSATTTQGWTSTETDITNKVSSTGAGGSKKIANSSGTNWEDALRAAQTMISSADNDPTFVVFITDGQPTQWHDHTSGYDTTGQGYVESRDEARAVQLACAATGTDSHGALFGIYAYGTEADYLDELMYYAYTGTAREMDPGTVNTDGYYNAADSTSLTEAINDIFSKIVKTLGITAVSISDGTTSQVKTTSGEISNLLEVDTSSYEYWMSINAVDNKFTMKDLVSGADVEYTVSSSGNNVTISWTKDGNNYSETYEGTYSSGTARIKWEEATSFYNYAPPAATFTDPTVDWNLSSVGTLLDGVTYEVTFDVYPSQYTYDTLAGIKNGDIDYDELADEVKQYLKEDGSLYTNTEATLTYTDTRTAAGEQTSNYENPDPVETVAKTMSVHKDWENALDARTVGSIDMTVLMGDEEFHEVTLTDPEWKKDSIYISTGLMRTKTDSETGEQTMQILDAGHDFTFAELGPEQYNWELVAPVIHPMIIDGTLTTLIMVDDDHPAGEAKTYELDGKTYYVADTSETTLEAYNYRRSNLNLKKTVTGEDAPEDATFPFSLKVNNSKADDPDSTDTDSDNFVWFSIYDTNAGATVTEATVSGVAGGPTSSGYYWAKSGAEITVDMKAGWNLRFTNLPTGTTYTFEEALAEGFAFDKSELTGVYGSDDPDTEEDESVTKKGKDADSSWEDGQSSAGTIQETNSTYTVEFTNNYELTDLEITKVWDDADDKDGLRPTAAAFAELLTLSPEVEGATPTVTDNDDGTYTITYTDLPRYNNNEEVTYQVTETQVEKYEEPVYENEGSDVTDAALDHGTIKNSHTPEVITIEGQKIWEDDKYFEDEAAEIGDANEYERPPVTITLTGSDGSEYTVQLDGTADTAPAETVTDPTGYESAAWAYTFINLPKYKDGEEITYTVDEDALEGFEGVVDGNNVKNTPDETEEVGTIDMTLKKTDAETGNTIDGAVFTLTGPEGEGSESVDIAVEDGEVTHTFTKPGTYTLAEKTAPTGYEPVTKSYTIVVDKELDSIKLKQSVWTWIYNLIFGEGTDASFNSETNTLTVPNPPTTTNVEAKKEWDDNDNQDGKRDDVVFQLYKGDTLVEGSDKTIAADATGDALTVKWEDLIAYEDGEKIEYTVKEQGVENGKIDMNGAEYTVTVTGDAEEGFTIKNSYTPEVTEITADKTWLNADGSDTPPEGAEIVFTLLAGGEETDYSVTLNGTAADKPEGTTPAGYASDEWTASFINMPKYKAGVEIEYTVEETSGYTGYTVTSEDPVETEGTITNKQDVTEVGAVKAWKNANGEAVAPANGKVTFTLYKNGTATDYSVTLDGTADEDVPEVTGGYESAAWVATFVNLPKVDSSTGEEITYTVAETEGYPGYEADKTDPVADGEIITNTQEVTEASATKEWYINDEKVAPKKVVAQEEKDPNVTYRLYADGDATSYSVTLDGTADSEPAGTGGYESEAWVAKFVNLPKIDSSTGEEITYTIAESEGYNGYYASTLDPVADGGTISNKHDDDVKDVVAGDLKVSIDGELVQAGQELTYTIKYTNNSNKTGDVTITDEIPEHTTYVDASDGGTFSDGKVTWTFKDVAPGKGGTVTLKVKVDEDAEGTIENDAEVIEGGNNYTTNTVTTNIPVKKVEKDGEDVDGQTIEVGDTLTYVIEYKIDKDVESVTVTDKVPDGTEFKSATDGGTESDGTVTWNLTDESYLTAGTHSVSFEVVVTEDALDGDTVTVDTVNNTAKIQIVDHPEVETNEVENEVKTTHVNVYKIWADDDNRDGIRPGSVTVTLDAQDEEGNDLESKFETSKTLSSSNDWKASWDELPTKNSDGVAIVWTVSEATVSGYDDPEIAATIKDGGVEINITNPHTPETTTYSVKKVWNDEDNKDGSRPDSVTVQLYANGKATDSVVTLNEDNDWSYTWENLYKNENGKAIVFSAKEVSVPDGYEATYEEGDGLVTITNSHEPKEEEPPEEPTEGTNTGDNNNLLGALLAMTLSALGITGAFLFRRREQN